MSERIPPDKRTAQARVLDDDETPTQKVEELVALGRRLLALREAAGLTQEGLAHAAGLHWTYVGQVERGERNLSYKNVLKLAMGLGVEPAGWYRMQCRRVDGLRQADPTSVGAL